MIKKHPEHMLRVLFASKPVSRVLSFKTAIYLDAPLPMRSSRLPGTVGPTICPSTALLRIEFTATDASTPSGGRLSPPFHPYHCGTAAMAVYLCCTFPGVAPGGCYPLSLPCGARTFLTHGPFTPYARLSSLLANHIVPYSLPVVKRKPCLSIEILSVIGYNTLVIHYIKGRNNLCVPPYRIIWLNSGASG